MGHSALVLGIIQRRRVKTPTGQRFGITMHHSNSLASHLRQPRHGQSSQLRHGSRVALSRVAQAIQDTVGACDGGLIHFIRIGTTTTRAAAGRSNFSFHIAAQTVVGRGGGFYLGEEFYIHIKPMKVPIEHQLLARSRLLFKQSRHGAPSFDVAVEAAHHVEHIGL